MKQLILVRHAKTEPPTTILSDFERQLKKRGHNDARLVANDLKDKGYFPDLIVSSPAVRAIQTARVFADVYDIPAVEIRQAEFIYDAGSPSELFAGIISLLNEEETVVVIGHNPAMLLLADRLTNQGFIHFPTTATLVVRFEVDSWTAVTAGAGRAEYYVYPRKLKSWEE